MEPQGGGNKELRKTRIYDNKLMNSSLKKCGNVLLL